MTKSATPQRWKVRWTSFITIAGAALLVGVEVFGAAFAGGWAIGGILGLGNILTQVLMALLGLAGAWVMFLFLRTAIKVEPIIVWDSSEGSLQSTVGADQPPR